MTARKRKSPDLDKAQRGPGDRARDGGGKAGAARGRDERGGDRRDRREPGLIGLAAFACLRLAARYPARFGAVLTGTVVFGTIAVNAMWYQHGQHPSPFLRTRDPQNFSAMLGLTQPGALHPDGEGVTTFRIQRQGSEPAPPAPPAAGSPVAGTQTAGGTPAGARTGAAGAEDPALIAALQTELIRLGLYDGAADGRRGPRTDAAVAAYQRKQGLPATGLASEDLLATISLDSGAARPPPRPTQVQPADAVVDPVAAAIRSAEAGLVTAPSAARPPAATAPAAARPAPIPAPAAVQAASPASPVSPPSLPQAQRPVRADGPGAERPRAESVSLTPATAPMGQAVAQTGMIMDIQRGLINISYGDISVDGVAGERTRAAIRHFERHYRLPETGEPNAAVLAKLKSIGAL